VERIAENFFNAAVIAQALPAVLRGFLVTVEVSLAVIVAGIAAGTGLALLRCARMAVLDWPIALFVDVFRTLPQLVVLIFLYFGLPYLGLTLSPFLTVVLGLGAVLAAFSAEIVWSAILALPRGQWDAARALGLRPLPVLLLVVLPQAVRLAAPLLTNRAIAITKGTALGTAVSLPEALGSAQSAMSILANPSPLTLAAGLYLLFFVPLVALGRTLERRAIRAA
jgi:His/Glu/Gln/Arg/opine family amino acid ABC transporter permease subunit